MRPRTRREITDLQRARDSAYATSENSPIPRAFRRAFRGLRYFPIDEKYQFKLKLHRHDHPAQISISLSNGEMEKVLNVGYFTLEIDHKPIVLQAYEHEAWGDEGEIHVPFKDRTSGEETYGAGRYVDLKTTPDDNYVLDFNLAYNPSCAYDRERYKCPIPPRENWLSNVEIRAGEMKFTQPHLKTSP